MPKDKSIIVRCDDCLLKKLDYLCKIYDMKMSELIRFLIEKEYRKEVMEDDK